MVTVIREPCVWYLIVEHVCDEPQHPQNLASMRLHRIRKGIEFLLDLLFRIPVTFLQDACELIAFAGDHRQIVVRQLAPLLLDLAGHLLPVTLDLIPIHDCFS